MCRTRKRPIAVYQNTKTRKNLLFLTGLRKSKKYPQGDLNPCCRRERAASWAGLDDGGLELANLVTALCASDTSLLPGTGLSATRIRYSIADILLRKPQGEVKRHGIGSGVCKSEVYFYVTFAA